MTSSCNAKVTLELSGWVLRYLAFTHNCTLSYNSMPSCVSAVTSGLCEKVACMVQVLKQKFPGVLLVPDICALPGLPQVCIKPSLGTRIDTCCRHTPV